MPQKLKKIWLNKKDNKYWGKYPEYQFGKPKPPKRILGDPEADDLKYYFTSKGRRLNMTDQMIDEELQRRYEIKKDEIREEIQDTLQRLDAKSVGDQHTVAQAVNKFFESRLLELEESTRPAYIRHLNMVKQTYGHLTLNQFDREKIIEFRESLLGVVIERKGNGLGKIRKPKTVNRHIASVQSLFTAATKDWGWYEKMNPCSQIRQLSEGGGVERDPLTPQEIMRLWNACLAENENKMLLTAVVLALSTGAREAEIWDLKRKQINFDEGTMMFLKTKNKKKRSVGLYAGSLELLKMMSEQEGWADSEYVFPSRYDVNKSYDFRLPFKKAKAAAGIENFRWHDFRHCTASFLMMAKVDRQTIKEIMGWKSDSMLDRYVHLTASHTSEGHQKMIDKFLKDLPKAA
jgi:integrase